MSKGWGIGLRRPLDGPHRAQRGATSRLTVAPRAIRLPAHHFGEVTVPKKSSASLTKEQVDLILRHLDHAMFFAHAADQCGDDQTIQLTRDSRLLSRAAIAHVGHILMRCAEDLGVPRDQLEAISKSAK